MDITPMTYALDKEKLTLAEQENICRSKTPFFKHKSVHFWYHELLDNTYMVIEEINFKALPLKEQIKTQRSGYVRVVEGTYG